MEASFDTEESFDDPSCLAPQPPGSVSPAKRQIKEVKETKITVSQALVQLPVSLHPHQQHLLTPAWCDAPPGPSALRAPFRASPECVVSHWSDWSDWSHWVEQLFLREGGQTRVGVQLVDPPQPSTGGGGGMHQVQFPW